MSEESGTIAVRLLGEPFRIRGGNPEEVEQLARYVEAKFEEVRSRNEGLPLRNLWMLTSLNISEELFRERRDHDGVVRDVEEKARRLRATLEARMQESMGGREV